MSSEVTPNGHGAFGRIKDASLNVRGKIKSGVILALPCDEFHKNKGYKAFFLCTSAGEGHNVLARFRADDVWAEMQAAVEGGKEIETRVTCLLVREYEPPQLQTSTKDWAIALVISLESDDQNY